MKIVTVESLGISSSKFELLKQEFMQFGHEFIYYTDRNENPDELVARMRDADIVIISNIPLSAKILEQCSQLKMLSVAFTGLDHIDLEYCKCHHIEVRNASGYSTIAVSEAAVGLMIDVYRKITEFDTQIRQFGSRGTFLGSELHGKTVGVVGTGAIGRQIIKILQAFGCQIVAYSRTQRDDVKKLGVHYMSLQKLLQISDIVTLHLPLNAETKHLIDKKELALMKSTAILINTARGNVVNIDALSESLKIGQIAGAGFDVYECEPPLPKHHPLLNVPNCIMTPHIAYATQEAFAIRADIVMDHVREWINKNS